MTCEEHTTNTNLSSHGSERQQKVQCSTSQPLMSRETSRRLVLQARPRSSALKTSNIRRTPREDQEKNRRISGEYQENIRRISGEEQENIRRISGEYQEKIRRRTREYQENIRRISGED